MVHALHKGRAGDVKAGVPHEDAAQRTAESKHGDVVACDPTYSKYPLFCILVTSRLSIHHTHALKQAFGVGGILTQTRKAANKMYTS